MPTDTTNVRAMRWRLRSLCGVALRVVSAPDREFDAPSLVNRLEADATRDVRPVARNASFDEQRVIFVRAWFVHTPGAMKKDALPIVFLARHAQTAWTTSRRHTGMTDLPLTLEGEAEAIRPGVTRLWDEMHRERRAQSGHVCGRVTA